MTTRATVLLADDHVGNAALLRELLEPTCTVVAQVSNGHALVAAVDAWLPDVVVTDISMPGLDGIEATEQILARHPQMRIVLVTVHADSVLMHRGLGAGALGFVVKRVAGDELEPVVRAVLRGERCVRGIPNVSGDGTPIDR